MSDLLIRCSSLGRIMTSPTAAAIKAGEVLSAGAKTYIRRLAAESIFGVEFEVSSVQMEKGILCEQDSIDLLNRVRGLSLVKNAERKNNGIITGECDLYDAKNKSGYDIKTSWSIATFPITEIECVDSDYEWQARGYMALWDADSWSIAYAMVNTPEHLIRFEPVSMHFVDHIPEHMRLTTWAIDRDAEKEARIVEKVKHANAYFAEVIEEFAATHQPAASAHALADMEIA